MNEMATAGALVLGFFVIALIVATAVTSLLHTVSLALMVAL